MQITRIFLQKKDKNIEKNKAEGNDRLPYFELVLPPEQEGGKWITLGALWKKPKGYSGLIDKKVKITVELLEDITNGLDIHND